MLRRILLLVCCATCASALQLNAGWQQLQRSASVASQARPGIASRLGAPQAMFGGPDPPSGISRDTEPEEFFKTKGGLSDSMSDAEKFKSPAFFIGIGLIVTPFLAGLIALFVAK